MSIGTHFNLFQKILGCFNKEKALSYYASPQNIVNIYCISMSKLEKSLSILNYDHLGRMMINQRGDCGRGDEGGAADQDMITPPPHCTVGSQRDFGKF